MDEEQTRYKYKLVFFVMRADGVTDPIDRDWKQIKFDDPGDVDQVARIITDYLSGAVRELESKGE
jgi:hypothetical protein